MFEVIADCHVLLAGGMGVPAWEKARSAGLQVILTGGKIEDALKAYANGALTSDERRLHQHRH
jgi:predicted Fe-Mo cluster-binding NifX family protein